MKKSAYIFFIIALYLFLFTPPIYWFTGRLAFSNLFVAVSMIAALLKPGIVKGFYRQNKKIFTCLFLLLIYTAFRSIFGGGDTGFITKHVLAVSSLFLVIPLFFFYAQKNGFCNEKYIVKAVLIVGSVAAVLSMLCLFFPAINQYVKGQMIIYEESDILNTETYRGFGIAAYLTSNYGYIQGFIAALGCWYLKDNRWFLFYIPFIILSALINARTGVLLSVLGIIFSLFSTSKSKYSILIGCISLFLFLNYKTILTSIGINEKTVDWIFSFGDEISNAFESGSVMESSTADTLLGRMWIMPDNLLQWIFGRGYSLFHGGKGVGNSDVGWILQLNYGGLIYVSMLYSAIIIMIKKLYRSNNKSYMYLFIMVFLIINTKTSIYPHDTVFYLMFMVYALKSGKIGFTNYQLK